MCVHVHLHLGGGGGGGGGEEGEPFIFTCAPVSVAMSTTQSAFRSFLAYATPSPSTSLPSASVLLISTVFPEYSVWMSSGRVAWGPTAFSARQKTACRFCENP